MVVYLLNLPPNIRDDASNALITHIIPDNFDRNYTDTWLELLVDELRQLHKVVQMYDRAVQELFHFKAHTILITGDGPAIANVMGMKSPGKVKQSCRLCRFSVT